MLIQNISQAEYKGSFACFAWPRLNMQRFQSHPVLTGSRAPGELFYQTCDCVDDHDRESLIRSCELENAFICFASRTLTGRGAHLDTG